MANGNNDYHPLVTEEMEMGGVEGEWDGTSVRVKGRSQRSPFSYQKCLMAVAMTSVVSVVSFSLALLLCSHAKPLATSSKSVSDSMNESIDPCEDFYGYACGGWVTTQEIPSGYYKWDTINIMDKKNKQALHELLSTNGTQYKGQESTAYRKAKDFFRACMNETRVALRAGQPLYELLLAHGGWPLFGDDVSSGGWNESTYDLTQMIISAHKVRVWPYFEMWVTADDRNSSANIIQIVQSGLGLNYPEMYKGSDMAEVLEAYGVLGAKTAAYLRGGPLWEQYYEAYHARFKEIVDFEVQLSKLFVPKADLQDPTVIYHKMSLQNFSDMFPLINMSLYMQEMYGEALPLSEEIIIYTPAFFPKLVELLNSTSEKLIVDYHVWQVLQKFLTYVSKPYEGFVREFQEVASGVGDLLPRWQQCVEVTDQAFGFATGAMFVDSVLPQNLKEMANEMVDEIKDAFIAALPDNAWMDDKTRGRAREKAESIVDMVGHPSWIESPAALDEYFKEAEINPLNLFENYLAMRRFSLGIGLQNRGKPVNSSRWDMTPATVNAYYNPSHNQIVFPSGIFQAPFYSTEMPMAMSFGGIGMVMGHELTHGFDSQGRKYDKQGNLKEWWEPAAAENFLERSRCLVDQYSQYTITDQEIRLNGNFTLPENIADNGGVEISYKAFKSWQAAHPEERDHTLPGLDLNPDQLYFLGFAQTWCSKETAEHARISVMSDSHSPAKYRVIGSISNSAEFAKAFSCPAASRMNPKHKCKVW